MKNTSCGFGCGRFGILWCMAVLLSAMFLAKAILAGQDQVDCPPLAGAQEVNSYNSEAHPTEICKLLTNKTASEKAHIKSREIAKRDFKGEYTNTKYGVRVEIIGEVKEININGQRGVELFAKAWRGDKQLGFGKDGSVEIERFRIFNPPILVDDPNGDVVREWTDSETGLIKQRKLREDPFEAIRQTVTHNVKIVGKENAPIVLGKIGNTTSTFYPDANPETTSVDGIVARANVAASSWGDMRNGDGTYVADSEVTMRLFDFDSSFTNDKWSKITRGIHLFDTSAISDTDTIDSATLSFYGSSKGDQSGGTYQAAVNIYSSNPASNTALAVGDYTSLGSTDFSTEISYADFSTSGYNDFALNASGLSAISKTGVSKFGTRESNYDVPNSSPTWVVDASTYMVAYSADQTGTSQDPKLVVEHSAPTQTPTPTPTPIQTDTTAPSGSVSINSGASYTNSTTVTVTLSATDTVGVTGYYLSTNSSTPIASASGWNSVTSTTSYSGSASYPLTSGDENKTVYAWFKDAAGNVSSTASDSIILDTTAPIVTITSPTSGNAYTATGSTVSLSGNASDSLSGISSVTWSNDKGGSGDASGTTYWSVSNISLSSGDNKITVTAKDNVGNTSTDTITVTYTASTAPTVKTGSATNVTANSATLSGTVNANGLSTTAWFEYGTLSGSYGSKSSTQTVTGSNDTTVSITITGLTSGTTYYYKVVAENNSGKSEGSEMSFQYTQSGNAPTVETEAATDITNTTAKLNGKCNPNGQSTTAWFEYGTLSGTYNYQTSTQSVSGSSYTNVSATITGLTVGTKYYYRIAAQNSAGTSYGTEMSFYKSADTQTTPTPQTSPTPTPIPTSTATEKGVIVGTVLDEAAGVGISGAKIISDKGGYSATTGFDGTYTIENVTAGDYTLTASADGYKSSSQAVTVYAGEASVADFILTRESGGVVFGFVLDENGDALEGVTVAITGRGNNQLQSTETDDDGYYEFRDLEAGEYTLTFEKSGYRIQTLDITLTSEESLEAETITMELEVKGSIFGYVVDIYGDPIESVRLKLKGIKTKIKRNASSDADGFFEFTDLDADKYVIFASKKRYKKTKQTVSLDEGDEQEIQIEMRKSSSSRRIILETEE